METKLIMVEGIPGSGKSTMADRLSRHLASLGLRTTCLLEGERAHPINLAWHAYLTRPEYEAVLREHPLHAANIARYAMVEPDYALVPYRDGFSLFFGDTLGAYFAAREFTYGDGPVLPLAGYTDVVCTRWRRFAEHAMADSGLFVLDASFLQHTIHDLLRLYDPETDVIVAHLDRLLREITPLAPVLFYIAQADIQASLRRTAARRNRPSYQTAEALAFWTRRKRIEYEALARLPLRAYVLDNTEEQWDTLFATMLCALSVHQ